MERISYVLQLDESKYDKMYKDNLQQLMNMGLLNFQKNL